MSELLDRFSAAALKNPGRAAYVSGEDSITYGQLFDDAKKYASLLKRGGTSPVIIYGGKEVSFVKAMLACLMAGRAYVPVGSFTPPSRLRRIIRITDSDLVLSDLKVPCGGAALMPLAGLEDFRNMPERPAQGDTAYIIFTSGSTGEPKGVPITYDNLDNFVRWISALPPLAGYRNVTVLNQASFSFDLSVADLYYSLCGGHTLRAFGGNIQDDPEEFYRLMKDIDVCVITPTFIKLCLLEPDFRRRNYPGLKCVYFCGEPLDKKTVSRLFDAFPDLKVINAYGPTEATSAVSAALITPDMTLLPDPLPCGTAGGFATDITINDGEIILKGKSVSPGYLNGEQGGFFTESGERCFRTGDLGEIRGGRLYCAGRKDSQIKYKGYRIELGDIENNIREISGVRDCAVIAKHTPAGVVKGISAFVESDRNITESAIRSRLRLTLPEYMIPRSITITDRLPVNRNGKTDRKALDER